MNKTIVIVILCIILIGGGLYFSSRAEPQEDLMTQQEDSMVEKEKVDAMIVDTTKPEDTTMMQKEDSSMQTGSYETYSPEKLSKAESGDVVLFFRASWCPTCRALDADIKANLGKIPPKTTILDVDYDNSTELKKKYGVTYQHTLVQVDSNGNLIKKWSGSESLDKLISNIK